MLLGVGASDDLCAAQKPGFSLAARGTIIAEAFGFHQRFQLQRGLI